MTDHQLSPVWVVIPAAGVGQRMKSEHPKQYLKIHGKTLIEHTLSCFLDHEEIAGIIVVLNAEDEYWHLLEIESRLGGGLNSIPVFTVHGGNSRTDSVIRGLEYLEQDKQLSKDSWVLVHDAARPCLSKDDLDALLAIRDSNSIGGLLASPVRDTMKRAVNIKENKSSDCDLSFTTVSHTESRENLWHALTPQMFRLAELQKSISHCQSQGYEITDESSAVEFVGEKPIIVECLHNNIKVTHPSDVALASFLLGTNNVDKD